MPTLSERGIKLTNSWAKYKNGMTTETWKALNPRMTKEDDKQRALAYMAWKTGERFDSVVWVADDNGVQRIRYVYAKPKAVSEWDKKRRRYIEVQPEPTQYVEIPHWDFSPAIIEDVDFTDDEDQFPDI
jgi:hypothetical protein